MQIDRIRTKVVNSKLGFLFKDAVLYGGSAAVGRMLNVFILPLIARELSTSDYGALDGLRVFGNIILVVSLFGLDQSAVILSREEGGYKKKLFLGQALLTSFLNSLLFTLVLFLFSRQFLGFFDSDGANYLLSYRILICSIPFMTLFQFSQSILKWHFKRKQFLIITIGNILLVLISVLFLGIIDQIIIANVLMVYLLGFSLFALVGLYYCKDLIKVGNWFSLLPTLLLFGWPFLLDTFVVSLVPSIDRYFISEHLSLEALGFYAIAFRISSILKLPLVGLQMAFGPFALSNKNAPDAKRTFTYTLLIVTVFASILAMGISINAKSLISLIASKKYISSYILILPLSFAIVMESMSEVCGYGIILSKKTYYNSICFFLQLISSVLLIYIFVARFELLGIAYGVLISKVIYVISKTVFSKLNYSASPNVLVSFLVVTFSFVFVSLIQSFDFSILLSNLFLMGLISTFFLWIMVRNYEVIVKYFKE